MILLETQYFPSVAWCAAIWHHARVAVDAAENYQKGGLRNRCYIAGPGSPLRLSIPLTKGKHQQTPIREVRISCDTAWQRQHWRSIQTAYGNAPFFEHYADDVRPFFERRYEFLFDLNHEIQELILKNKLGWPGEFVFPAEFTPHGKWAEGMGLRQTFDGSPEKPLPAFIPKAYPQVFESRTGFLPNLSVLDLLFCCGKSGAEVLSHSFFLPN